MLIVELERKRCSRIDAANESNAVSLCVSGSVDGRLVCTQGLLCVLFAGLVAAWFAGVTNVTATWASKAAKLFTNRGCGPVKVERNTVVFDLIVFILNIVVVARLSKKCGTLIGAFIVDQSLIYFLTNFLASLLVAVLSLLQLSPMISLF